MLKTKNKEQSSLQISKKTFFTSIYILGSLIIASGILTRLIPTGVYERKMIDGRMVIDPNSFRFTTTPVLPILRWLSAPIEVLFSEDALMLVTIILFILIIGATFNVLEKSRILQYIVTSVSNRFHKQKYVLLAIMSLVFMLFGATIGIFEEIVVLVPIIIVLSYSLGWDSLVGLGMSILSVGFGFAAAIFNPFTIGVAQQISNLPLFSGALFRGLIFIVVYLVLITFLYRYAKRIEKNPKQSLVYEEDRPKKENYTIQDELLNLNTQLQRGTQVFSLSMIFIVISIITASFIPSLSGYSLPLVALLFLFSGIVSSQLTGMKVKKIMTSLAQGMIAIAPGILLILLATSVKHIIVSGEIMDTILYYLSSFIQNQSPFVTVLFIYVTVLVLNFFIGSGSAKAFLVMPIIAPLGDLIGINRQIGVLAFTFGDGFSNMIYPTNAVLIIALGLTIVSYPKWLKWTFKLQLFMVFISIIFLWISLQINYGPY